MQEIPLWYWLCVFFALGACVGSFYNVIVYRMPRGISLLNPPSHCPICKKHIPIYLNLPIIGWLMLRGKSACCKQPISVIYPIGETLCGVLGALSLYAATGFDFNFLRPITTAVEWTHAFALFWLLLGIYPVSWIDFKYKLIPDSISVGGIVVGLMLSFAPGGVTPVQSLIGCIVCGGFLFLIGLTFTKLLHKEAMGFGDVKLLAGFGAIMGATRTIETLVVASIIGIIATPIYNIIAKNKTAQIPFGPFLAIAAPFMFIWGYDLLNIYVNFALN